MILIVCLFVRRARWPVTPSPVHPSTVAPPRKCPGHVALCASQRDVSTSADGTLMERCLCLWRTSARIVAVRRVRFTARSGRVSLIPVSTPPMTGAAPAVMTATTATNCTNTTRSLSVLMMSVRTVSVGWVKHFVLFINVKIFIKKPSNV